MFSVHSIVTRHRPVGILPSAIGHSDRMDRPCGPPAPRPRVAGAVRVAQELDHRLSDLEDSGTMLCSAPPLGNVDSAFLGESFRLFEAVFRRQNWTQPKQEESMTSLEVVSKSFRSGHLKPEQSVVALQSSFSSPSVVAVQKPIS